VASAVSTRPAALLGDSCPHQIKLIGSGEFRPFTIPMVTERAEIGQMIDFGSTRRADRAESRTTKIGANARAQHLRAE